MSGIEKLMAFLDGSPSCFHAVANLTRRLEEAGYTPLSEAEDWQLCPGKILPHPESVRPHRLPGSPEQAPGLYAVGQPLGPALL